MATKNKQDRKKKRPYATRKTSVEKKLNYAPTPKKLG